MLDFSDDDVDDESPPVTTTPTANSANLSGSPAVLAIAAVGEMFAASEEETHVLENMTGVYSGQDPTTMSSSQHVSIGRVAKAVKLLDGQDVSGASTALQLSLLAVATAARLESIETKVNLLCAARSSGNGAEVPRGAAQIESTPVGTSYDASPVVAALQAVLKGGKTALEGKNMVQNPLLFMEGNQPQGVSAVVGYLGAAVSGANSLAAFGAARNVTTVAVNGRSWNKYPNISTVIGLVSQLLKIYKEWLVKKTRAAVASLAGGDNTLDEVKPGGGEKTTMALKVICCV